MLIILLHFTVTMGFPCGAVERVCLPMQVQFLGQEDPVEEEMATHFSILAWKIPWTEEPGWMQSVG